MKSKVGILHDIVIPIVLLIISTTFAMAAQGVTQAPGIGSGSPPAESAGAAPMAVFPQTDFTFGTILEGTAVKHDFVVENQGKAVLEIQKVQPD